MTKRKKSKMKGNKLTARQLKYEVEKLFKRHPKKRLNPKQVAKKLKVVNNKDSISYAIEQLVEDNKLIHLGDYKYGLRRQPGGYSPKSFHEGIVDMTRTGAGYIICDDRDEDVYVSARNMNSALNGDRVKIKAWVPRGRQRAEGEVLEVLERAREHFMGTLWLQGQYAVVITDFESLDIVVHAEDTKHAENGDKVVVKVTKWDSVRYGKPVGMVTSVLGAAGSSDIEMKAILINAGFQLEFPAAVMRESEGLKEEISEAEVAKRRDMREVLTFTIDPDTAKDFDDAISLQYLETGDIEIGVHIADVSHYVKPETALDKEALSRSTSVYLVDRVLPMLPEKLSNELCSLRPHEDKLTFSAVFTFDKDGKILDRWFGKTVTHSDRRFTYGEAQLVLDTGEGDFASELKLINRIAKKLRKKKFKNGAINFETEEVKFRLDEEGSPVDVFVKIRKDAHMLIEDFMLLANREVATFIANKGAEHEIPFVYRVHDEPNPDKVIELARFAQEMDFDLNISSPKEIAASYNRLNKAAESDPRLRLLGPIAIRTMAKAEYTTDNIGHYGLAFSHYSHFTSPIRRYSDVLAHRILEKNLPEGKFFRVKKENLEEKCQHISKQERRATEAERESIKYKQVEYMEKHVGEIFNGFVSGIIDRGLFVEMEGNRSEGMIAFETMGEPFDIADSRLKVKGIRSGKVYAMGDQLQVKVVSTDLSKRRINLELIEEEGDLPQEGRQY